MSTDLDAARLHSRLRILKHRVYYHVYLFLGNSVTIMSTYLKAALFLSPLFIWKQLDFYHFYLF